MRQRLSTIAASPERRGSQPPSTTRVLFHLVRGVRRTQREDDCSSSNSCRRTLVPSPSPRAVSREQRECHEATSASLSPHLSSSGTATDARDVDDGDSPFEEMRL